MFFYFIPNNLFTILTAFLMPIIFYTAQKPIIIAAIASLVVLFPGLIHAQTVLWAEDFSGPNQGWSQNFIDCDGSPGSFAGVQNGRFEIVDMEGGPCCAFGGANGNEWITDSIDVSAFCEKNVSITYGFTGMLECEAGGPFFTCQNNGNIDNGHDQMVFEYSLDGGPWVQFAYVCGEQTGTAAVNNLGGRILRLRIRAANKAAVEMYWFDDVRVTGNVPAPTVLFSQNPYFGCSEAPIDIFFGASSPGASIVWTNNNVNTGIPAAGTGNINTTANLVTMLETSILAVHAEENGCIGPDSLLSVLIFPIPSVTNPGTLVFCGGQAVDFEFNGSSNAQFIWTNSNPNIGLSDSGTGNLTFTATTKPFVQTATVLVVPASFTCLGQPESFTVQINPRPDMAIPPNISVCSGSTVNQSFIGLPGTVYTWTNNNPAIGLAATGQGNLSFVSALLDSTQVATIVVTPELNGCTAPPRTFTITVGAEARIDQIADVNACGGALVNIPFTGNGNLNVNWTNSNPNIGLPAAGMGNLLFTTPVVVNTELGLITATATLNGCGGPPMFFALAVNPSPTANISGNSVVCSGESTTLSAGGGVAYQWQGGPGTAQYTVSPLITTTYLVTVTGGNACTDTASVTVTANPVDVVTLQQGSCLPADTGVLVQVLQNQFGCDSTVTTVTVLYPTDTVFVNSVTCNPGGAGTFTKMLQNRFGCDSTVVETVVFDPLDVDSTLIQQYTCDANLAGINQVLLIGADNCDSLVITTVTFIPADTTNLSALTCDPNSAGVTNNLLINQYGCDSLVISTVVLAPTDTTTINTATCDTSAVGVFTVVLQNAFGCDSTVVTVVQFDPNLIDTTVIQLSSCDPGEVGTQQQLLSGVDGCDSLVLTVTALLPTDTTYLSETTCDTLATGTFVDVLTNQYTCDSVLITTVVYDPGLIDTTIVALSSCDPGLVGLTQQVFNGVDGCDSVVITQTSLLPTDTTYLSETTCNPALAGIFSTVLNNQYLCDSLIVNTVTYDPDLLDITVQTLNTCNLNEVGTLTELLTGSDGCDSVSVTVTVLNPLGCAISASLLEGSTLCVGGQDGTALITVLAGLAPFEYNWSDQAGNTGAGFIDQLGIPVLLTGLAGGSFSVTITSSDGSQTSVVNGVIDEPDSIAVAVVLDTDYAGFGVSCFGGSDGAAHASAMGGATPYTYNWTSIITGAVQTSLTAGSYAVTVTDANGCTAQSDSLVLTAPAALGLAWRLSEPGCGDTLFNVLLDASGGLAPYVFFQGGQPVGDLLSGLPVNEYLVSVQDSLGCTLDTTINVQAPVSPWIILPGDTLVRLGDTIAIGAQTNVTAWQSLTWTPLPDPDCPQCLLQTWAPANTSTYRVEVVDTFGCRAEAQIEISVAKLKEIYVPNVFTPDEDGVEDLFVIHAGKSVALLLDMSVYNRWGNLVYHWDEPIEPDFWPGWDGRIEGETGQSGVYVYVLRARRTDGREIEQTGDVTIVYR